MAGYSATPLIKKLGIKPAQRVIFVDPPENFATLLGPLPANIQLVDRVRPPLDFIAFFSTSAAIFRRRFPTLAAALAPDGMLWICWPKKSSGVATDLNFDVVQTFGLAGGLVDVKICAVDEIWSGLKFVIRKSDRSARAAEMQTDSSTKRSATRKRAGQKNARNANRP